MIVGSHECPHLISNLKRTAPLGVQTHSDFAARIPLVDL